MRDRGMDKEDVVYTHTHTHICVICGMYTHIYTYIHNGIYGQIYIYIYSQINVFSSSHVWM